MGVWVTGDTHADWFTRFNRRNFKEQKELTKDDYMIILGDFGLWHDDKDERYRLDWLADKPWTTLWIDGNHENYDRIYSSEFPIVDYHGGKAQVIRDNIMHLMRGNVYDLCGKKFFAFGGASSHDISDGIIDPADYDSWAECRAEIVRMDKMGKRMFRINHLSWWEQELPSQEEMSRGIEALKKHDYNVDYVITHCLPQTIASIAGYHNPDTATTYFNNLIEGGIRFKDWFCGHYHREWDFGRYHIRYYKIERIV